MGVPVAVRLRLVLLLTAASLALAACGEGGGGDVIKPEGTTKSPMAGAAEKKAASNTP